MTKRTIATNWSIISKDETGAFVDINYSCPYCRIDTGEMIFIGASNVDKIDNGFETDQVCSYCREDVIVECR